MRTYSPTDEERQQCCSALWNTGLDDVNVCDCENCPREERCLIIDDEDDDPA